MRRLPVLAAAVAVAAAAALVGSQALALAGAGSAASPDRDSEAAATDETTSTTAARVAPTTTARVAATTTTTNAEPTHTVTAARQRPAPVAPRSEQPKEELRFGCERASDGEHRGIACRWGEATGPARAYVLYRSVDHGARESIYRTGPDGRLGHFDAPLRPGHRYTYAVVALDSDGNVIGYGAPVTIGIPPPEPSTDALRSG